MNKIILLSDHVWFYITNREQAQAFVNQHNWKDAPIGMRFGIYISFGQRDIIFCTEGEESK